jgi:hypothetical protein
MRLEAEILNQLKDRMKKYQNIGTVDHNSAGFFVRLFLSTMLSLPFWSGVLAQAADSEPYLTPTKPVIDGIIDSAFYQGIHFSSFKQIEPYILMDALGQTAIYFIYDQENIYIAGNIYQDKNSIKASSGRRDAGIVLEGDYVILAIDPLNNGNAAQFFVINPANGIADGLMMGNNFDYKWDAIFRTATKIYDDHWTFEFQLPISSINFQSKDEQTWGVMFIRNYALIQEKSANQIVDKDNPLRVDDFYKVNGLKNLKQKKTIQFTPYIFSSYNQDFIADQSLAGMKSGGELKFRPTSSMSLIATFNPDFAQVEADAVIVNVNDVPVSLPERRPFFTESSDLYPGLAVNTRNIKDIKTGVKLRQVVKNFKYDATWVQDKEDNHWYLGNIRYANNKTFHAEVISGTRNNAERTDYNITTNLRGWAFNRRLTFYNWFGTINGQEGKNEFETVNSVQWVSRELNLGLWSHVKTELYNPNIVGHNTLSNEIIYSGWVNYTYYPKEGLLRQITSGVHAGRKELFSAVNTGFYVLRPRVHTVIHPNDAWGNLEFALTYQPGIHNFFRYRNIENQDENLIHQDTYGPFILTYQNRGAVEFKINTDNSKKVGLMFQFNNYEIRKSSSRNIKAELFWKMSSKANITYGIENILLEGSVYQRPYAQTFHRLKAEYNINDLINIRTIMQLNDVFVPHEYGFEEQMPLINFTASWQYSKGSFIYLVINKYVDNKKMNTQSETLKLADSQWIGLKINKTFIF